MESIKRNILNTKDLANAKEKELINKSLGADIGKDKALS